MGDIGKFVIHKGNPLLLDLVHQKDLVVYDPSHLWRSSNEYAWWHCSCQVPWHVTFRTCDVVNRQKWALHCYICHGDPPHAGQVGRGTSDGEARLRGWVHDVVGRMAMAVHVHPWKGCTHSVDIFLPQLCLLVHHDGRSHDELMPVDRKAGLHAKLQQHKTWDLEAQRLGLKALRLHWEDCEMWADYFFKAVGACCQGDMSPLYTPSCKILTLYLDCSPVVPDTSTYSTGPAK